MSTLLDTNLLLRSTQPLHPMRQPAAAAIAALRARSEQLCLVPQNLYEFWVACTRPISQNGLGMTAAEAETKIAEHKHFFTVLNDTPDILPAWERLVAQHQVLGKGAHDARLVAAMRVHGLTQLLTFNTQDFRRFPGIVVLSPLDVLQPQPPAQGPTP